MDDLLALHPYVEPPWSYQDVGMTTIWCRTRESSDLHALVPPQVEPRYEDGRFALLHLDVGSVTELGPTYRSNELALVIPVHTPSGSTGGLIAFMLVDNDAALAAGREIWGHPKVLGRVTGDWDAEARHLRIIGERVPSVDGAATTVIDAAVRLDETVRDGLDELDAALRPRLLVRASRDPATGRPRGHLAVALQLDEIVVGTRVTGAADVRFGSWAGLDRLGEIEVAGAMYQTCQFTLDYGAETAHGTTRLR